MMKIYLGGPMGGIEELNFPLFNTVARWLRYYDYGTHVFNPAETEHTEAERRKGFAENCKFICEEADALVMLPGWRRSKNARAEAALTIALELPIYEYNPGDDAWRPYLNCVNQEARDHAAHTGLKLTTLRPAELVS